MNKYVKYDKDASALELVKIFKQAKKERLKRAYELKFIYTQEMEVLLQLIKKKSQQIELMAISAQRDRENDSAMYIN